MVVDHPAQGAQAGRVYGQAVGHTMKAEGEEACFKPGAEPDASSLEGREQGDKGEKDRQDDRDGFSSGGEASCVGEGEEERGKEGGSSPKELLPSHHQTKTDSELEEAMVNAAESSSSQRGDSTVTGERKENEAENISHGEEPLEVREQMRIEEDGEEDTDGNHWSIASGDSSGKVRKTYARREYGIALPPELSRFQEELCRLARADPVVASSLALDAHDTWRVQRAAAETDDLINQRKRLLSHRLPLEDGGASSSSFGGEKKRKTIRLERNKPGADQNHVTPSAAALSTAGTRTQQVSRIQEEGDGEDGEEKKRRKLRSQEPGNPPGTTSATFSVEERQAEDSSLSRYGEETQVNKEGHVVGDGFRQKDGDSPRKQQKRIREEKGEDLQQTEDNPLKKAQEHVEDERSECSSSDYYDSECDSMYGELLDLQPEDEQVQKHLLGDTNYSAPATGNDFVSV